MENFTTPCQAERKRSLEIAGPHSIATGQAAFSFIRSLVDELIKKCNNYNVDIYNITNQFFGEQIRLPALFNRWRPGPISSWENLWGRNCFISSSMLKNDSDLFWMIVR
jgi:hypothetical protein